MRILKDIITTEELLNIAKNNFSRSVEDINMRKMIVEISDKWIKRV